MSRSHPDLLENRVDQHKSSITAQHYQEIIRMEFAYNCAVGLIRPVGHDPPRPPALTMWSSIPMDGDELRVHLIIPDDRSDHVTLLLGCVVDPHPERPRRCYFHFAITNSWNDGSFAIEMDPGLYPHEALKYSFRNHGGKCLQSLTGKFSVGSPDTLNFETAPSTKHDTMLNLSSMWTAVPLEQFVRWDMEWPDVHPCCMMPACDPLTKAAR